jgi:hypothetical protein
MDVSKILEELDAEITRLQEARSALVSISGTQVTVTKRRGRPKGSTNAPKPVKRPRKLTAEGRKRIAEAQQRRWAEARKKPSKSEAASKA